VLNYFQVGKNTCDEVVGLLLELLPTTSTLTLTEGVGLLWMLRERTMKIDLVIILNLKIKRGENVSPAVVLRKTET
jgi:hypothetical protein